MCVGQLNLWGEGSFLLVGVLLLPGCTGDSIGIGARLYLACIGSKALVWVEPAGCGHTFKSGSGYRRASRG